MYYLCSENNGADLRHSFRICKKQVKYDEASICICITGVIWALNLDKTQLKPKAHFQSLVGYTSSEAQGFLGEKVCLFQANGNKGQILRGTGNKNNIGEQGTYENKFSCFLGGTGEQANLFQGNSGTCTPPPPTMTTKVALKTVNWKKWLIFVNFRYWNKITNSF